MLESDRGKFAQVVAVLTATFGRPADEAMIEGWWIGLQDLALEAVQEAAQRVIRECEYPPVPATIRRLAGAGGALAARDAWMRVLAQIRATGTYGRPVLSNAEADAVAAIGGWMRLCRAESDELHGKMRQAFEREFAEATAPTPRRLAAGGAG